jgi:CrcB protein
VIGRWARLGGVRASWDRDRVLAVAGGAVAGATLRWAVTTGAPTGRFPWAVLLVNVVGSFLLGVVLAAEWTHPRAHLFLHDAAGIGFCGSLTTFSTFAVEVVDLTRAGALATAVAYGIASVAATIAAVLAGAVALHRVRALLRPLEQRP